jgi:hypothetical protein
MHALPQLLSFAQVTLKAHINQPPPQKERKTERRNTPEKVAGSGGILKQHIREGGGETLTKERKHCTAFTIDSGCLHLLLPSPLHFVVSCHCIHKGRGCPDYKVGHLWSV